MQKVRLNILMVEMRLRFNSFKLLIIVCSVEMLLSCKQQSLSNILCGDDKRYWEYEDDNDRRFPIYFLFDKNGRWLPLEQDEKGSVKKFVLSDCLTYNDKWSLQEDTLLYLGWDNIAYTIQYYCDSLVLLKQGNKSYKLRRIDDFQDVVRTRSIRYQELQDSIKNTHYGIIVDSTIMQGYKFLVVGTTLNREKATLTFNKEEGYTLDPHKNDTIIKKKYWVIISKFTKDSVFLYNYFMSSRKCELLNSGSGLKASFKPSVDGVPVN